MNRRVQKMSYFFAVCASSELCCLKWMKSQTGIMMAYLFETQIESFLPHSFRHTL